jgi:DNA-binding beta-propeller fold protein YncE
MRARTVAAFAVILACAGCSGTAQPRANQAPGASAPPAAAEPAGSPPAAGSASVVNSVSSPGCSTASAQEPRLTGVRTAMVTDRGSSPFGIVVTPDGRWAFAALGSSVEVYRIGSSLAPVPVRVIRVPATMAAPALGETLTPDARYLLVATGSGAAVLSVARAEQGDPDALLGTLSDPASAGGAIEVAVSPDGDDAFVTEEDAMEAAVFNLHRALTQGFSRQDLVGDIPLGGEPVGLAVSPDGHWLYATSELAPGLRGDTGTLTVISMARAQTDPAGSVAVTVTAGCNPVRVITSADGRDIWVTARASDDLLCFSASALRASPAHALLAVVRVGEAPVGLRLVRSGTLVVVADSNRFVVRGATASLSVVNVAAALAGRPAVIGSIPAGLFPREMALVPGGRQLLVSNYASGQLEAVNVPSIR